MHLTSQKLRLVPFVISDPGTGPKWVTRMSCRDCQTRRYFSLTPMGPAVEGTVPNIHLVPSAVPAMVSSVAEETWCELIAGNERFVRGNTRFRDVRSRRLMTTNAQHPKAIVIGCSDSRTPPELIFDQTVGDLFVVRVAGNVVDAVSLGSVEYAAEHLHCRLVIVLGHDSCGAVQAACSATGPESANLNAIIDELRPSVALCSSRDGRIDIRAVVEENVRHTADKLLVASPVLRRRWEDGKLQIATARYDLVTGEVLRLQ